MEKGGLLDEWKPLRHLCYSDVEATRDLFYACAIYPEESKVVQGRSYVSYLTDFSPSPLAVVVRSPPPLSWLLSRCEASIS